MKKSHINILLALVILLSSCKKIVEDVNVSPNSPTDAPSNLLLNGAQVSSIVFHEGDLARLGGMWSSSFTGVDRQYTSLNNYTTTSGDYDNSWSVAYRGVIAPSKLIIEKETPNNNKIMIGIAQVMQAHTFGMLTSLFGNIPFTEAGDPAKYPTPKFDDQVSVYAGVQKLLSDGIANLQSGVGVSPGSKDIFYKGVTAKWIKAANTLKARFYMHVKDYANAITYAKLGISASSEDMIAPHGTNGRASYNSDFNLYYSFAVYDRNSYMDAESALAPKLLDPSSPIYRGNAKTDESARGWYLYYFGGGLQYGGTELNVLSNFDGWGIPVSQDGFFGGATPFPLVTFAENQLILAEAYLRLATPDLVNSLAALNAFRSYMNNGGYINSGYYDPAAGWGAKKYDPYLLTDFAPSGIANPGSLTTEQALLAEVIEERYVTLIAQLEQFNDVRRTKNAIGIVPTQGSKLPQRFLYPQSEINTNPNTPSQTAADLFVATKVNQ